MSKIIRKEIVAWLGFLFFACFFFTALLMSGLRIHEDTHRENLRTMNRFQAYIKRTGNPNKYTLHEWCAAVEAGDIKEKSND